MPSNRTIANVVLNDLDRYFQDQTFSYAFIKNAQVPMSLADLPRLAWSRVALVVHTVAASAQFNYAFLCP